MKLRELYFKAKNNLDDKKTIEDLNWLIEDLYSIKNIAFHLEDEVDDFVFFSNWEKLNQVPIQYLLGYGYFLGLKLKVNKNVLIPRNETEELVIKTKDLIIKNKYNSFLDIGVGSGAIIIGLKSLLNNSGYEIIADGVDISKEALEICDFNIKQLNLNCKVVLSDVYSNLNGKKYDVIISNPPYIDENEFVEERVKNNEPHIALYAENHGLEIYEKILIGANNHLNMNGLIAFEIAPERVDGLKILIKKYLPNSIINFEKDINGFVRFCFINVI